MLLSPATDTSNFIAAFNLLTNGEETIPRPSACEPTHHRTYFNPGTSPNPKIEASVAESAGLSRFVYIVGNSKHRYVFSSIQKNQISLYSEAVFVVIDNDNQSSLWVGNYSCLIARLNSAQAQYASRVYVHLLAEGETAKSNVIADLSGSTTSRQNNWELSAA